MKITVVDFSRNDASEVFISFSCPYGIGKGIWKGLAPEVGQNYFVEFTFNKVFQWSKDISLTSKSKYSITESDGVHYLIGLLESLDDDSVACIRIGDSIFLIETIGKPYPIGSFIQMEYSNVEVYPYSYD